MQSRGGGAEGGEQHGRQLKDDGGQTKKKKNQFDKEEAGDILKCGHCGG